MFDHDIIVAPATAFGGAISVIRLSGNGAIECCDALFRGKKPLAQAASHTLHYGEITDNERVIDDVLVAVFRAPHSYTGEDSVEISIHGSRYIASEVMRLLCQHGARLASAGEFSARAFAEGKIDLSQAEAVADIIAADSRAAHAMATTQMRGGYSQSLKDLRAGLTNIVSLLELELDFSEEEVEFADRNRLHEMLHDTNSLIARLMESFRTGNAIRSGIRVAIVGEPNVGKSTLLNRLVGDDRAMVSDIAGTTRDTIEEEAVINDIRFRFIDTAGLRHTDDRLEQMGIDRTRKAVESAQIVIRMVDARDTNGDAGTCNESIGVCGGDSTGYSDRDASVCGGGADICGGGSWQTEIVVANKSDLTAERHYGEEAIYISAREGHGIEELRDWLCSTVDTASVYRGDTVVSNARHYEALLRAHDALLRADSALQDGISAELLSEDIRLGINALGEITGEITSTDILNNIFSHFCIGK